MVLPGLIAAQKTLLYVQVILLICCLLFHQSSRDMGHKVFFATPLHNVKRHNASILLIRPASISERFRLGDHFGHTEEKFRIAILRAWQVSAQRTGHDWQQGA